MFQQSLPIIRGRYVQYGVVCSFFAFLGEPLVAVLQILWIVTLERIAGFDSFEKNQNPRIVSFSYFKRIDRFLERTSGFLISCLTFHVL
jgi:hypothetical protein